MAEALHTPLYDEHVALGATIASFAGYSMPIRYAGIIEEHTAVRSSAGVFDVSHMAAIRVSGFEAFDVLQELCTNDLHAISSIGAAQYTLVCDEDGGIIDDVVLFHTGDFEYLIIANASNRAVVVDWLTFRANHMTGVDGKTPDVRFSDESVRTGLIALQGPRALDIVKELAEPHWKAPPRFNICEVRLGSMPALVSRTGYTGEDGVEIILAAIHASAVWRRLLSFPEVAPCGLGARDLLRLEMGYPLYGSDIDRGVDPVSAGLSWCVDWGKLSFVGKVALERIRESGPARQRVGLISPGVIPRTGCPVLREGSEVSKVACGTFSPTLRAGIAITYLPTEHAEPGTVLEVSVRKKIARTTVVRMPFISGTSLSQAPRKELPGDIPA